MAFGIHGKQFRRTSFQRPNCETLFLSIYSVNMDSIMTDSINTENIEPNTPSPSPIELHLQEVLVTDFKNQRKMSSVALPGCTVTCSSHEEFIQIICDKYSSYCAREVVCVELDSTDNNNNTPQQLRYSWSTNERPTIADKDKYIVLLDPVRRKEFKLSHLNVRLLVSMRARDGLVLIIHKYTTIMGSKLNFYTFTKELRNPGLRDRSNAASMERTNEILQKLRQKHELLSCFLQIDCRIFINSFLFDSGNPSPR